MSYQEYFKTKFYDLVLKKSLSLRLNQTDCYLELMDQGKTVCMLSLLYEKGESFSEDFIQEVEALEAKGLLVDNKKGQILIARKHDFVNMSPQYFALRMAQFLSEIQGYREDIDGFKGKEYVKVRKS